MSFTESIRIALENLKSNKLRSFLTMLGIIIGISAVITITTIGSSLQKTLEATMQNIGGINYIEMYVSAITPDLSTDEEWEAWEYPDKTDEEKLTYEDLVQFTEAFSDRVSDFSVSMEAGSGKVRGDSYTSTVSVSGISPGYIENNKIELLSGRKITDLDNTEYKATAMVSDLLVKYALGGENPIGKQLEVEADDGTIMTFYVVGVYKFDRSRAAVDTKTLEKNISTAVYVPYTYISEYYKTQGVESDITDFSIGAKEGVSINDLKEDTISYFNQTYYNESGNFELLGYDIASELTQVNQMLNVVTIVVAVIAAISLLVGGVGVMNIMLVSVIERTREIGIRKAMGAKNRAIQLQFLMESVVICSLGGAIGIVVGILNGFIIAQVAKVLVANYSDTLGTTISVTMSPSITAILISVGFSVLVGVVFGNYPAKRAANMSPIDALRYE